MVSVSFGINYWIKNCGMHDVKDEDLKGKALSLTYGGYASDTFTFTKCVNDASPNCTLYVEAIGNVSVTPKTYNGKEVKYNVMNTTQ